MLKWFEQFVRRRSTLVRTPSVGRPRTYSADSGYVYEYSFAGFRRIRKRGERVTEYVFDVTHNRSAVIPVSVMLRESVVAEWSADHRETSASERYGIVKLALKRALDEWPKPQEITGEVWIARGDLDEIANVLDL